jgi:hypothetical protein
MLICYLSLPATNRITAAGLVVWRPSRLYSDVLVKQEEQRGFLKLG